MIKTKKPKKTNANSVTNKNNTLPTTTFWARIRKLDELS